MTRYVIITDENIKPLYGESLFNELEAEGNKVHLLAFPAGEEYKTQETKSRLEHQMLELGCDRETIILALGGGVVGDVAGFVAATFMRGIPYVYIPTTLLAMVDSSIGGKTGINTAHGKNLIGAFWEPKKVSINLKFLETASEESFKNGLVEAVKMFLTSDADSFVFVEKNLNALLAKDKDAIGELINRARAVKEKIVAEDLRESGLRTVLNFGHTVGHALELLSEYRISHGHAVALGILLEAKMAELDGFLSEADMLNIRELMAKLGFSAVQLQAFGSEEILEAMKTDKKRKSGEIRYTILTEIAKIHTENGQYVHPINPDTLRKALYARQ